MSKIYLNLKVCLVLSMIFICGVASAQKNGKITGVILSNDNQPIGYVSISLAEIKRSTVSQEDGTFNLINVKPGDYTLKISHVGKATEQQSITVNAGQTTTVKFVLSENAAQLSEVVINTRRTINKRPVTIGKMKVAPMDLPQSIVTIGQDVIEEQQATRLSDVIKNANGVYLYSTRGGTQETFAARGYNFSSTNMFKNGFRVNSGVMPEVTSLEKVEILKGSAALLYGNVAPGGILNMVTKKPKFEQGGSVSMTAGSYSYYRPTFDVYGPISKNVAYRVNGTYENAKSYRDVVKSERFYINPSFLFRLSDKTNILVEGDYLRYNFTPDFGTGVKYSSPGSVADPFTGAPRSQYYGALWSDGNTKQATTTATINHEFNSDWQLSGGVSYQRYDRGYIATERIQPAANGIFPRPLNQTRTSEDYYTGQLNLTGKFNTGFLKHNVLIGVDADRYNNINYTYTGSVPVVDANGNPVRDASGNQVTLPNRYVDGSYKLQSSNYDQNDINHPTQMRTDQPFLNPMSYTKTPTNRFGAYVNDLISLSEKFKLMAGVRWSYQYAPPVRTTTYAVNATQLAVPNTYNLNYNNAGIISYAVKGRVDAAFSPRVGIVYKPLANTSLFASYSNSFTPNTGIDVSGNNVKPSIISQFEAGIKNEFFDGNLSVNATVYHIKNNNLAQTAPFLADGVTPNSNSNIKVLAGETKSDGVELDIAGHPVQGLDVIAGYAYNYARFTNTQQVTGNVVKGDPLLNTPKNTANASVFYTFSSTALKGFRVGASAFYLGKRYAGFNNLYVAPTAPTPAERLVPVKGFATVDLSLGYTYQKFSILGKLSNITDVLNYNVHENYSVNPIAPRQFIATATYRF